MTVHRVDRVALTLLWVFVLSYQLQGVASWIGTFAVRELLYAFLLFRIATAYRGWLFPGVALACAFLLYAAAVALHTLALYGPVMAAAGASRFVNVALLAPITAVLVRDSAMLRRLLYLWLGMVVIAAGTVVFQALGGDMSWLASDLVSMRGGLIRFMTLLGESNVGGMAAAVGVSAAILLLGSTLARLLVIAGSVILLVFSLSKAAVAGTVLGLLIIAALRLRSIGGGFDPDRLLVVRTAAFRTIARAAIVVVGLVLLIGSNAELQQLFTRYSSLAGAVLTGQTRQSRGLGEDLEERLIGRVIDGVELASAETRAYPVNVLAGSSYGIAGTAAVEVRGSDRSVLPHNTFAEMYLVGGLILLGLFLGLLLLTFLTRLRQLEDAEGRFLFVAFMLCVLYMPTYPIFNQPVMGALFWLIVGVSVGRYSHVPASHAPRIMATVAT